MIEMGRKEIRITVLVAAILTTVLTVYSNVNSDVRTDEGDRIGHPESLEDCYEYRGVDRQFCIADIAEIRGEREMCDKISNSYPEISLFCVSRIEGDREGCRRIEDGKLREVCLDNIKMKNEWNVSNDGG